ncbi:uncharacterized protein BCR38DRAFT_448235 [Pseudomassariella vexata]|uniref:Uncharacterized protein n=1 Tax=Pseudomassariella vexata TaxID=1141098 RepID=A0A1Y2DFS7_9PEZI|nr:uncharacterized protein BCR38DRAFT_448235 [Pseudomassariella vexata]ORY58153.1 hypothetical protein BCR38DRAFT_448235 [Pseudomassariella vexata]
MVLLVGASFFFFVKWTTTPSLPVAPSTLAGAMHYVVDSNLIDNELLEDRDLEDRRWRSDSGAMDKHVRVHLGRVQGLSGQVRTQVWISNDNDHIAV